MRNLKLFLVAAGFAALVVLMARPVDARFLDRCPRVTSAPAADEARCPAPGQPDRSTPPPFSFPGEPSVEVAVGGGEDQTQLSIVGLVAAVAGLLAGYVTTREEKELEEAETLPTYDSELQV